MLDMMTGDSPDGRDVGERLHDRALLMLVIGFGEKAGRVDQFRLMKIPFCIQHELNAEGIRSFSYRFYRAEHGPVSKAIYEDRDALRDAGLVAGGPGSLQLTKLGDQLFSVVLRELSGDAANRHPIASLEKKATSFAALPSWEAIKPEVYCLPVAADGVATTVAAAPVYSDILEKLPTTAETPRVKFPERLTQALALAFSMSPEDVQAGCLDSGLTFDQVFAGV